MVQADSQLKLLPASILVLYIDEGLSTLICLPLAYSSSLTSYTHTTKLRFWGSGSLVELKCYHYVIVEADSNFKLLPTSILDKYKVFEHSDMLFIGIQQLPYTVILTLLVFEHSNMLSFGIQ